MRYHRSCALLHTLSRRSQLSVGSCGSMLHDRVLAPRPRPWAWRTFIALSCAMTGANAARKRSSLGLHKGGYSALVHVFTRPGGVSEDVSSSGVPWGFPTVTGSKSRVRFVAARRLASERCSLSAFLPAPDRGQPFGTSLSWGVPRTRSSPNITAAGDSIISPTPSSC